MRRAMTVAEWSSAGLAATQSSTGARLSRDSRRRGCCTGLCEGSDWCGNGTSNPEIGTRLFPSPRAIVHRLRKLFTKLDIASRNQLQNVLPPLCPDRAGTFPSGSGRDARAFLHPFGTRPTEETPWRRQRCVTRCGASAQSRSTEPAVPRDIQDAGQRKRCTPAEPRATGHRPKADRQNA
jgi:hypothetical protein